MFKGYRFKLFLSYILVVVLGLISVAYPIFLANIIESLYDRSPIEKSIVILISALILARLAFTLFSYFFSSFLFWRLVGDLGRKMVQRLVDGDQEAVET